ncbi:MAG: NAD(P)H-dependent oxidoreductase [Candidatus Parvarchaeum sp.]|nr:NAD(P)H-dependent oxidoreductase [Candidatus Parvarchaeota archaeon]MCW1295325.1 NAD(P)H-dependent oxidoreductase [Candidatus Parvarchaeum tengchongense]MCW1299389.1 NAD(P)H-dependent oxidoreductase [Candidatus Parvarchaeum tengchongense]
MEKITIAAIAGSLRRDSFNKAIINTAKKYAPENIEIEILDLKDIPLFNQDEEKEMPESVKIFKEKIKKADAVLIATPEYDRSIPGVLKNAIDWASRPYGDNSFDDKAVATIGASGGAIIGTAVAQYHLRQIFSFLNAHPLERPQIFIGGAGDKIENGLFVDEDTVTLIKDLVQKLAEWAIRLRK